MKDKRIKELERRVNKVIEKAFCCHEDEDALKHIKAADRLCEWIRKNFVPRAP